MDRDQDPTVRDFLDGMRRRWEERARRQHRYFTDSVNFSDEAAWKAQADREAERLLEALDPDVLKRCRLLDLGCGPARLLARMAPHVRTAVGVDIAATMLARAREACRLHPNVSLVRSGGSDLALFRDGAFDLVVMHAVAFHLPLPLIERYLREGRRVLAPGGRFRFTLHLKPADAVEEAAVDVFMASAVAAVPDGVEHLVHGPDYSGHRFEPGELSTFLAAFGFAGFRTERVGLETVAVDAWV